MEKFSRGQRVVRTADSSAHKGVVRGEIYYVLGYHRDGYLEISSTRGGPRIDQCVLDDYFKAADTCGSAKIDKDRRLLLCSK